MDNKVDLDLMEFVEQQILPRYNAFGRSHGIGHVQRVIKNALELVSVTGANPKEMVLHRTTTHYERSSRRPSC